MQALPSQIRYMEGAGRSNSTSNGPCRQPVHFSSRHTHSIIRVRGRLRRLQNAKLDEVHPIVLDPRHPTTKLLIKEFDERLLTSRSGASICRAPVAVLDSVRTSGYQAPPVQSSGLSTMERPAKGSTDGRSATQMPQTSLSALLLNRC